MKAQVLDCTLRDGGYVNDWNFGKYVIGDILDGIIASGAEMVECGFLSDGAIKNSERTMFSSVHDIDLILPKNTDVLFVAMINYGDYDIKKLPRATDVSVQGIRVVFHKKSMYAAVEYADNIAKLGYKVFLQPMVTGNYSDEELIALASLANNSKAYAIYLVDSFGVMRRNDLMRLFYLYDNNLRGDIKLGFHSHNNIQLSYANAIALLEVHTTREIIVDVSVLGMGRGAGNLNSELFLDYLNVNFGSKYVIEPLLNVMCKHLDGIYKKMPWGYSFACYLSSKHNCHPYYAGFINEKKELNCEQMEKILDEIPEEKLESYDENLIKKLWMESSKK